MSEYERRSYIPSQRPPPIIINREPEVRPQIPDLEEPTQRPPSLTFVDKLYNLFHPKTKRIVVTETRYRRRRYRPEGQPPPSTPPPPPHSSSAPPLGRRHSISGTMPQPHIPLPPPVSQDSPRTRQRPEVETRAPVQGGTRIYPHPQEPRERVLDSSQSPPPRQTDRIVQINEPVRSRNNDDAETRDLRRHARNLSQDLQRSQRQKEDLERELAKQKKKDRERIESLERKLQTCMQDIELLRQEKITFAAEAHLERTKAADARAALEEERQRSRERERALEPRRRTTIIQQRQPAPRPTNASQDAIRRAQEDAARDGRR